MNCNGTLVFLATVLIGEASPAESAKANTRPPVEAVRSVLNQPENSLDYFTAASVFDQAISKGSDTSAAHEIVVRLTDAARQMAGPKPSDAYKLAAVRKAIYGAGAWN
ncbi:MAG TPA: hypothetical protein VF650_14825 [Allosphingosinicella sp.]|jgi:hypothetical protein